MCVCVQVKKDFLLKHWNAKTILCKANHLHIRDVLLVNVLRITVIHIALLENFLLSLNRPTAYFVIIFFGTLGF